MAYEFIGKIGINNSINILERGGCMRFNKICISFVCLLVLAGQGWSAGTKYKITSNNLLRVYLSGTEVYVDFPLTGKTAEYVMACLAMSDEGTTITKTTINKDGTNYDCLFFQVAQRTDTKIGFFEYSDHSVGVEVDQFESAPIIPLKLPNTYGIEKQMKFDCIVSQLIKWVLTGYNSLNSPWVYWDALSITYEAGNTGYPEDIVFNAHHE
jgi:hypothetical protein